MKKCWEKGSHRILSDLLYFVRQENGNLIYKMNEYGTDNKQSGLHSACDGRRRTSAAPAWEDWERLLQEIVMHSNYEIRDSGYGWCD